MTGLLYLHMTQKSVFYTHIRIPRYVTCVRMGGACRRYTFTGPVHL